ncbi:rhomboid family intramembrane serine protease [Levilactobacillus tujiorum]|uniref:Rhomboid family intramembrane serine protease n=1 Tax=Levilactobacillus tujiorum TaxID=2912243 RepID=A0ABX1L5I9_9LACO|nr:rhomboid family intramembrane serine protease [Levilactobacillus tujiorum]MCH5464574.1 rhomboid family intramembrane serine protease [Levilactobacillus tujiorum]NLR11728.1 rhomboid family intramembrane serine protease [Lactobacillus sp. HBUAS51387]NLR29554.1 rhomboid family intramembrane serine protease [Levilactobacillus tujiorum]
MAQFKYRLNRLNQYPFMTIGLIVIMVLVYGAMTLMGGSTNVNVLITFGAKLNALIQQGEWWRLVTPMFLHIGFTHILMNMITLYFVGMQIEAAFGHTRFLVLFLVAGVGGNVASFCFSNSLSAGASTAIFGLFGAFMMLGESFWQNPVIRQLTQTFLAFVVMNILFDLFAPGIDLAGHLGGLAAGFLVAYSLGVPRIGKVSTIKRVVATIVLIGGLVWLYLHGMAQ